MYLSSKFPDIRKLFLYFFLFTWVAITAPILLAAEFGEGDYVGTGFEVRKDGKVLFNHTMIYKLNSSLQIERLSNDLYKFTINAEIQQSKSSTVMKDRRVDRFRVLWKSHSEGELINQSSRHKDDRCRFEIKGGSLKLDCWIERNQVWETQYYQAKNSVDNNVSNHEIGFAEIFDIFCISSRLKLAQFKTVGEYAHTSQQFETLEKIDAKTLNLSNPDASVGYSLIIDRMPYFILFGERAETFGGPFCSIITELDHLEAVTLIKDNFTTFNFLDQQKLGPNEISVFEGFIPNMSDVALSVQTAYEMSSISLYSK